MRIHSALYLILIIILNSCVHSRPNVTSSVMSYGTIDGSDKTQKIRILWAKDEKLPAEDRIILNNLASIIRDECEYRGFDASLLKSDDDWKNFSKETKVLLIYPTFGVNEKTSYVPLKTHSLTLPSYDYNSGTLTNTTTGNSYNYSGYTTSQKTTTFTTGGHQETFFCRSIQLHFFDKAALEQRPPQETYLQKIESCGATNDIRKVAHEMIESAFNFFGKEGSFKSVIHTDVSREQRAEYE